MSSIKLKLVLLFLTMVLFVMLSSGIFIRFSIENAEANRSHQELASLARMIDEVIIQPNADADLILTDINNQQQLLGRDIHVSVLFDTGLSLDGQNYYNSSVIISAMAGQPDFNPWERAQDLRTDEGRVGIWMSFAVPITIEATGQQLIIYLRQNATALQESLDSTTNTIVWGIALGLVLSAGLGLFFAGTLTGPISTLTKISEEMAEGKLNQVIPIYSNDEIGRLAQSFNHMSHSLSKSMDMQKEFVANVSHEIRTPLTVIKTYTETLREMEIDENMTKDFLNTINTEVDRMTVLAGDLLQLSRFDTNRLELVLKEENLVEIMENAINQVDVVLHRKNQTIEANLPQEPLYCTCDKNRISQVFVNIITNGAKYSPKDDTIKISLKEITLDGKKVYRVLIKDHGMGIPKEDLERVFERFYRVDKGRSRAMGGTGLGLSIVKEILDAHNASIEIKSRINQGTEVLIYFAAA